MVAADSATTPLKRVAWLNRSGILIKALRYSEIKADLEKLTDEASLNILKELEDNASTVPDPVEFVKAAVENELSSQPAAASAAATRKRKAPAVANESGADGIVAKRVRLLNTSGQLSQPITFSRVNTALNSLNVGQAMTILKSLEDVAAGVSDPTAYIRTAVRSAGGRVPPDSFDMVEDGEPADETMAEPSLFVKAEPGGRGAKSEHGGASRFLGVKGEDLTDTDKIVRRICWINDKAGLEKPVDEDEVLPALDSIGCRQAMRVLRRLEESASTVDDPNEFVRDLVARSGWIWAKPDVVSDDEKVAKRVSWMNQFSGLQQPIDYAQVADALDGLKVPHAMVLLRELELQAHKIEDPTEYIKKTTASAGEDDIQLPAVNDDDLESSLVGQRIAALNQSGMLAAPIEFAEVADDLKRIGDESAMQLLQEVEDKGTGVKDPTGYLRFKLRARLASLGSSLEETIDDETKILKRIEWLNDYGGLLQDIDYNRVAATLEAVGIDHAMTVLKELEDQRGSVRDPNSFILTAISSSWKRAASQTQPQPSPKAKGKGKGSSGQTGRRSGASGSGGATTDLKMLSGFVGVLNKSSKLKKPIRFGEVATALDALGSQRALQVLQEMQEKGLGLDDPVAYIKSAAQRGLPTAVKFEEVPEPEDDVAKITKRIKWLNQFGGLSETIKVDEVVGALYCLGVPQSMAILRGLQEKGSKVPDPTWYIKAAVQRANGIRVAPPAHVKEELAAGDDEEEPEEDTAAEFAEHEADAPEEDPAEEGEAEEDPYADVGVDYQDQEAYGGEDDEGMGEYAYEEGTAVMEEYDASTRPLSAKAELGERRIVGGLSGGERLVPRRATMKAKLPEGGEQEEEEGEEAKPSEYVAPKPLKKSDLPVTPQEKMVKVRDLAVKLGLHLDTIALKSLARIPFYRARDLLDEVMLGGRNRQGVSNPSRYITVNVQKQSIGLGVEQGIAMELAVSIGVVLNNEALDELASIPRKESHAIIRELSRNADVRKEPMQFIRAEVLKCRANLDAKPWGR